MVGGGGWVGRGGRCRNQCGEGVLGDECGGGGRLGWGRGGGGCLGMGGGGCMWVNEREGMGNEGGGERWGMLRGGWAVGGKGGGWERRGGV